MGLRFGSVCSGIEAASVAWSPLGWEAAWLAEIEPFPSRVLAHHYPEVPNLGDMTTIAARILAGEVEAPDLLCGGTPCQSFSVAGLRKGLADERGNLALEFVRLADAIDQKRSDPAWILWENVPGVLSSAEGRDFGCLLAGLVGEDAPLLPPRDGWTDAGVVAGPTRVAAWRILDAQYFGVAQRRRRVFVLARGGAGGWAAPDALLPIGPRLSRNPPTRAEARQGAARGAAERAGSGIEGLAHSLRARANSAHREDAETYVPCISPALKARDCKGPSSDGDGDGATLVAQLVSGNQGGGATVVGSASKSRTRPSLATTSPTPSSRCPEIGGGFDEPLAIQGTMIGRGDTAGPQGMGVGVGVGVGVQFTLTKTDVHAVLAFDPRQVTSKTNRSNPQPGDPAPTLATTPPPDRGFL
jgi:DNA (cytosine-5)-methyltransferase 1